jgi:hypothetical protein
MREAIMKGWDKTSITKVFLLAFQLTTNKPTLEHPFEGTKKCENC